MNEKYFYYSLIIWKMFFIIIPENILRIILKNFNQKYIKIKKLKNKNNILRN